MSTFRRNVLLMAWLVVPFLLLGIWGGVAKPVAAQRPTLTPTPEATPTPTVTPVPPTPPPPAHRLSIHGLTINWGYRNEPGVNVILTGPQQAQVSSDPDGRYAVYDLGDGIYFLNVEVAEWRGLKPMTRDVAVHYAGHDPIEVNLGLYSGDVYPATPVTLGVISSVVKAVPTGRVTYTMTVSNNLPEGITDVRVTSYLPQELRFIEARASQGTVEWWNGLLTAHLGRVIGKGQATVTLVVEVTEDAPADTVLETLASLIYHEGPVVQSSVSIQVGTAIPSALPVTGVGLPVVGLVLAVLVFVVHRLRTRSAV